MTTNPTDLAAALNECMPLTHGLSTYERAEVKDAIRLKIEGRELWWNKSDAEIIGILWAECVRRGWWPSLHHGTTSVFIHDMNDTIIAKALGTDALAFARAFAAAKRAEGGGA